MSGTFIAPWAEPFNPDLGLWTSTQPGHTKPVAMLPQNHSGVAAACRLVIAGQLGILDQLPTSLILRSLRGIGRVRQMGDIGAAVNPSNDGRNFPLHATAKSF